MRKKINIKNISLLMVNIILITSLLVLGIGCQSTTQTTVDVDKSADEAIEPIELRFTTMVTSLHPLYKSFEKFSDEVNKRTNGKVKVVLYPSDTLNHPFETYNAIKNGLADIGTAPVGYSSEIMPLNKLFGDALMGVTNATEAAKIWEVAFNNMPELQKELEGMHVLWLSSMVPLTIGTTKTPINKLEDLQGLIMRFPPGLEPLAKAWGVSPINMPVGDIYVGLEKGTVDGFFGGAEMLQSMRLADFTKYATSNISLVYGMFYTGMNSKVWESLPEDVQKVFNDLSEWGQTLTLESFDESERLAKEFAVSQGCEFIEIEETELQRIYEASWPAIEQIAADLEKQGKPANKVLQELEKLTSQK